MIQFCFGQRWSLKFCGALILILISPSLALLRVLEPSDPKVVIPSPLFQSVQPQAKNFNITDAEVTLITTFKCSDKDKDKLKAVEAGLMNSSQVLMVVYPRCFPEDIAEIAMKEGFSALIIGSYFIPDPGLYSLSFWKTNTAPIPIVEIKVSLGSDWWKNMRRIDLTPSSNPFSKSSKSGGFIFLLAVAHLGTFIQLCTSIQRVHFNVKYKTWKNVATLISGLEIASCIFKHVYLIDPFGVYHVINFPASNVLLFFALSCSEISSFLLAYSVHRILIQIEMDFHGNDQSLQLKMSVGAATVIIIINIICTLLQAILGFPEVFFIMLNVYGLLQLASAAYFLSTRAKVLRENSTTETISKRGYREYQIARSYTLLIIGTICNVIFWILILPVSAIALIALDSGTSILYIAILGVILISISSTSQIMSLPGETREQWAKRHGTKMPSKAASDNTVEPPSSRFTNSQA